MEINSNSFSRYLLSSHKVSIIGRVVFPGHDGMPADH